MLLQHQHGYLHILPRCKKYLPPVLDTRSSRAPSPFFKIEINPTFMDCKFDRWFQRTLCSRLHPLIKHPNTINKSKIVLRVGLIGFLFPHARFPFAHKVYHTSK